MKTKLFALILIIIFVTSSKWASAQQNSNSHNHFTRSDSAAINALVLYPDSIRLDIFEACKYPEIIVRISDEQTNSSSDFDNFMAGYIKDDQENFWNLSRYPDLISKIVTGGKKSNDQINTILVDFPIEIHETALKYGSNYFDALVKIDQIQVQFNNAFNQIISDYPPITQRAFIELLNLPEVLNLLNAHLNITVLVGDRYKRNPAQVIKTADSLNLILIKENAQEVQAWKDSIQQNSDAVNDLKSAANDYATENGYLPNEINTPVNPGSVENYTCYPFSYCFGYPTWYPYNYWYPYPYWFDCGFYIDSYGNSVVFSLPSYNFTNWYFYYPKHWNHYPNLGNTYVNHYYGHRSAISTNTVIVHQWVRGNKNYLPKDFLTNKTSRVQVIKEVGQLNLDVQKQAPSSNVTNATRNQYLQNNISKYPHLNATQQPKINEVELPKNTVQRPIVAPVKQPTVRLTQSVSPQPTNTISTKPAPDVYNYNNVNIGQDYHKSIWEQSQPTIQTQQQPQLQSRTQPQQQQPQLQPRTQPQQQPQPQLQPRTQPQQQQQPQLQPRTQPQQQPQPQLQPRTQPQQQPRQTTNNVSKPTR